MHCPGRADSYRRSRGLLRADGPPSRSRSRRAIPRLDLAAPFIRHDPRPFRNRKTVAPLALKHEDARWTAAAYAVPLANIEISAGFAEKVWLLAHRIDSVFALGTVSSAFSVSMPIRLAPKASPEIRLVPERFRQRPSDRPSIEGPLVCQAGGPDHDETSDIDGEPFKPSALPVSPKLVEDWLLIGLFDFWRPFSYGRCRTRWSKRRPAGAHLLFGLLRQRKVSAALIVLEKLQEAHRVVIGQGNPDHDAPPCLIDIHPAL